MGSSQLGSFERGAELAERCSEKGRDFELLVSQQLTFLGWNCLQTRATGDFGADIIATCGSEKLVVQCKDYSEGSIGFDAVKEVFYAKTHYDADKASVIYRGRLTAAATAAADKCQVLLVAFSQLQSGHDLDRTFLGSKHRDIARIEFDLSDARLAFEKKEREYEYFVARENHEYSKISSQPIRYLMRGIAVVVILWLFSTLSLGWAILMSVVAISCCATAEGNLVGRTPSPPTSLGYRNGPMNINEIESQLSELEARIRLKVKLLDEHKAELERFNQIGGFRGRPENQGKINTWLDERARRS